MHVRCACLHVWVCMGMWVHMELMSETIHLLFSPYSKQGLSIKSRASDITVSLVTLLWGSPASIVPGWNYRYAGTPTWYHYLSLAKELYQHTRKPSATMQAKQPTLYSCLHIWQTHARGSSWRAGHTEKQSKEQGPIRPT